MKVTNQINVSYNVTDNGEAVETHSALARVISYIPYGEIFVEQQSGGWQSPYLFNAKELDSETGLYYYGARYLDPTHAMWMSVDPLWEKYVGMSPYGYCAGNPVRLVDPDGKKFTEEAEETVAQMENYADRQINSYTEKLNAAKRKSDIKYYNNQINQYEEAKREIAELRASEQVYDLKTYSKDVENGQKDLRGYVSYDQKSNVFIINVNEYFDATTEGTFLGSFAHELKHAYQFLTGRISFEIDNENDITKKPGYLYDLTDEVEAHKRGALFGCVGSTPDYSLYSGLKNNERTYNTLQFLNPKNQNNVKDDIYIKYNKK